MIELHSLRIGIMKMHCRIHKYTFSFWTSEWSVLEAQDFMSPLWNWSFVVEGQLLLFLIFGTVYIIISAIELSLGGSSPYTSTDKTNKNKYT